MLSNGVLIDQILSVDIKVLGEDGNEYVCSLHNFKNVDNSKISLFNETSKGHKSSSVDLHIACNGYTGGFSIIK